MAEQIYIEQLANYIGETVTIKGWLYAKTGKGRLQFLQVRDGTGIMQCVVFKKAVTPEVFEDAREELRRKKGPAAIDLVRLEEYAEGPSAQIMHVGPYSAEEPTIQRLHDFIHGQGRSRRGKHHEIYLSDPRRVPPERLRTIIRQPLE